MSTQVLDSFEIFAEDAANKAGVFGGTNYGKIADNVLYEISDFELEFDFIDGQDGVFYPLFSVGVVTSSSDNHWYLRKKGDNKIAYFNLNEGITYDLASANVLGSNTVSLRKYGTTLKSIINGGGEVTNGVQANIPFFSGEVHVVARNPSELGICDVSKVKFWLLDGSGNRVDELINLNWNNGNINTVPNIGTDAPASSDMTWVPAGSGTYIDV